MQSRRHACLEGVGPQTGEYTGRALEKTVTYVGRTKDQTHYTKEEVERYGFQIISFK